ncbi:2-phospho-L-lactate transferase [Nocardioides sp. Y6]|uniref:2-phospho-L-lactate transferase n=1 Tax=Nocardioides malaquae TaxID=2773426 RepID=A0ABR9RPH3_9ACTN|nr:2-phospho-L-lactate transferase [Nocardioides malaquae]MBE7323452.1 2-phospho-L-lactate transferase [Nocardioides malaquae]
MRDITVLSGGNGTAALLRGLLRTITSGTLPHVDTDARVTVVVNTADDLWVHGLKACPDLDTLMYALSEAAANGRADVSTQNVSTELAAYGVEPRWFGLDDRDVATHLVRTEMLDAGYPLSAVTEALCRRWNPGVRLLPMTDDRVEAHVAVADPDSPSGRRVVHLQEYRRRLEAAVPVEAVAFVGLDRATPAPGVVEAVTEADLVLLAPSDPVVSLGPVLDVAGVREALRTTKARVVGISPVSAGTPAPAALRQVLAASRLEASAAAVGRHFGARRTGGLLDGWVVDDSDAADVAALQVAGLDVATAPVATDSPEAAATVAATALALIAGR